MSFLTNPFPGDPDRGPIWTMLVERDIDAFVTQNWDMVDGDFIREGFTGVHAHKSDNPDNWRIGFPDLETYREEWLRQAARSAEVDYAEDRRTGIFRATLLQHIEIEGERAIAHKTFDGTIALAGGGREVLNWQTLYLLRKVGGSWKLSGFVGYMPFPMGSRKG